MVVARGRRAKALMHGERLVGRLLKLAVRRNIIIESTLYC